MSTKNIVEFVIHGDPCSKANSRQIVKIRGKTRSIKSKAALAYVETFGHQCPVLPELIEDDVQVEMVIYYSTRRPDLDESVILDCMQGPIYRNDRQVKSKIVHWGLDRETPRAEIQVRLLPESLPGHSQANRKRSRRTRKKH